LIEATSLKRIPSENASRCGRCLSFKVFGRIVVPPLLGRKVPVLG
jgi:hypothetical protein